jgi:hypothetical protein
MSGTPTYPTYPVPPGYPPPPYPPTQYPATQYPAPSYPPSPSPFVPGQPVYPRQAPAAAPGHFPYPPGHPSYGQPMQGPLTYPPAPGAWPQPLPPRKRKRWLLRSTVLTAIIALIVVVGFVLQSAGSNPTHPTANPSLTARPTSAAPSPTEAEVPLGPPTVNDVLAAQSHALLSNDLKGFLAPLAHANATTVALYKRMFANLHALRIARWDQNGLEDGTADATQLSGTVTEDVTIRYCIGDKNCANPTAVSMELKLKALKPAGGTEAVPQIVGAAMPGVLEDPSYANYRDIPPWAYTNLYFKQSGRVIVAASSNERSKLAYALPIAVRAAATADTFAHWGKPRFYIVYLANSTEFKKWFSPGDAKDVIGFNYTLSADDNQVTVTLPDAQTQAGPGGLQTVIQHEFGHSATLFGADPISAGIGKHGEDSFIEGIADLCAFTGHPSWGNYRTEAVRQYIRSGKWSGNAYLTKEMRSSSLLTVNAAYGIGYLAMRRLVEKYGLSKALDFWGAFEHDDKTLQIASTTTLGVPWATVNADIKAYIKKAVGA